MIVLVDDREKKPWTFKSRSCQKLYGGKVEPRLVRAHLMTGDYMTECEGIQAVVERKSLADLYSTLGQHRERFEAEVRRLTRYRYAAIVVEATASDVLFAPPSRSHLHPHAVLGTCLSWSMSYGVPFLFCDSREVAEVCALVVLSRAARRPRAKS